MGKTRKIILILIITFLLASTFNSVFAKVNPYDYGPDDLSEDATAINMANTVIGAFQAIGSIVSVLALVLIGVKYMMGSAEEKAEYKQTMMYYILGAILVFAVSNISALIYKFAKTL